MYFKINHSGCGERKGLVEVRYDLYLGPSDHNYAEHHVTVPVFPKEGYQGKVDGFGSPVDIEDYKKWVASLPTETRDNPFCCHFMQHDPTVTDAEILAEGEKILAMAYKNWQTGNLHLNKNKPVSFSTDSQKIAASIARIESIKSTDFEALKVK